MLQRFALLFYCAIKAVDERLLIIWSIILILPDPKTSTSTKHIYR
jgi:hypothetical protein